MCELFCEWFCEWSWLLVLRVVMVCYRGAVDVRVVLRVVMDWFRVRFGFGFGLLHCTGECLRVVENHSQIQKTAKSDGLFAENHLRVVCEWFF
jgi:hypothetical protein